jgi:hypothetical protein
MIKNKIILGTIASLGAFILVSCGGVAVPDPTPTATATIAVAPATPTIPATATTLTVPATPAASAIPGSPTVTARPTAPAGWTAKVTYEKSGGIAGIKQTLLVGPAGQARVREGSKDSGPVRLTAERLALLKAKLDATGFFALKEHYGTGTVSDDFMLTLSLTDEGQTKTLVVEQIGGQGVTPQALLDFIGELETLRGEIEMRPTPTSTLLISGSPTP